MSKRKRPMPLHQPGDSPRMQAALAWCLAEGLAVKRLTKFQIQVGPLSFYPDKGTFNLDGNPKDKARGLKAFKAAVEAWQKDEAENYL